MSDSPNLKVGVQTPPGTRLSSGEERRRTQRVMIAMPVIVHVPGKPPVRGITNNVSAGGALVVLPEPLPEKSQVTIENPATQESITARVVRPAQPAAGGVHIAFEFSTPSPRFWNISFPSSSGPSQ